MTKEEIETLVIGSGPGGYVTAIRAAQLGKAVTIVEKEAIGGVCLNVGCIPSKALITAGHRYQESQTSQFLGLHVAEAEMDFSQTQRWKNETVVRGLTAGIGQLLKKNNVKVIKGTARFTGRQQVEIVTAHDSKHYSFQEAVIATGSRPIEIKGFPFGGRILDSTGGLNLKEIPKELVIIGGGVIGSELGSAYADLGSKVTLLEGSNQLLPSYEKDMVLAVEKSFKQKGIESVINAVAQKAVSFDTYVEVTYEAAGQQQTVTADYVMVTVGRQPNTDHLGLDTAGISVDARGLIPVDSQYRSANPAIYAIGDVVEGLALAHKASYDAKVVAEVIVGRKVQKDYQAMPAICFTTPELATTGLTLAEAKKQSLSATSYEFPLQANGRAISLNQTEGFIRLIVAADQRIIGGQIVGANASELITEISLAVEASLTVEDISLTIHGHPTLSEAVMDVAELAQGLPIHI